nr:hypothetical protein [Microbacterium bovistercoris]
MATTGTPRPWSASLASLRPPRIRIDDSGSHARPVLLHQGFMIETELVWESIRAALHAAGRPSATLEEHYLRTIDSAHALGHDPDLPLAQSLAAAIDALDVDEVDVMAEGSGVEPALVLALNDARVRRLVLWRPAEISLDADDALAAGDAAPLAMTEAEVSIGALCTHTHIDTLAPVAGLRLTLSSLRIPVLIVDDGSSDSGALLARRIPGASRVESVSGRSTLGDELLIRRALDFLTEGAPKPAAVRRR